MITPIAIRAGRIAAAFVFAFSFAAPAQDSAASHKEVVRQRWEEFYRERAYPGANIPAGARLNAMHEAQRMNQQTSGRAHAIASVPGRWTSIGPRPTIQITYFNVGAPISAGRVSAMAVDPRNANVVYLGAATGGIWKTTDGGQLWTPLTDDQPSLSTGSLALAPTNPDIVYVGTGEQNFSGDSYYGAGVLKSIDGGATWKQLPGPFVGPFSASSSSGGFRIGAIAVHPSNPDIVLAGTAASTLAGSGIFRSADGGETWKAVLQGGDGGEVIFDPANGSNVYAAVGPSGATLRPGIYKSADAGLTWTGANGSGNQALPAANTGRIALAMTPSNPQVLYAGVANSVTASLLGLFKTTDGGATWSQLAAPNYCGPQCDYDNVIRVHPLNPNIVVIAGDANISNGIYRSLNGGNTWTSILLGSNGNSPHTDHHALAFSRDGSRLYDGNDGGAFSTDNLTAARVAWNNLNGTLTIAMFEKNFSIDPANVNIAYAGTQDNGTMKYTGQLAWTGVFGGDGESTAIDPSLPGSVYVSVPDIGIFKQTSEFPDFFTEVTNGIDPTEPSGFTAPTFIMDPSNPDRLYFGTSKVYQSNDGAGLWVPISPALAPDPSFIYSIAPSPADPNVVYASTSNAHIWVTVTANAGAQAEWFDLTANSGLPGRLITRVVADPVVAKTAYIAESGFSGFNRGDTKGHVFKTVDGANTWQDISGNLPNAPVSDLALDPDQPFTIYAATDVGVFRTMDAGETWAPVAPGLPNTIVSGLRVHRASRTLRAGTHGRGMWDVSVPLAAASIAPAIASVSPATANAGTNGLLLTLTGSNFGPGSVVRWRGADRPTTVMSATRLQASIAAADLPVGGRAAIVVFTPVAGAGLSNTVNFVIGPAPAIAPGGVVSAANPVGISALSPGAMVSIYGTNLSPVTVFASAPPLPYTLGGVVVEVNNAAVPLSYVSPTQIIFQVPHAPTNSFLTVSVRAQVVVINNSLASSPITVKTALFAPTIYSTDSTGTGQGTVLINGPEVLAAPEGAFPGSRPARKGESVEIYATGLGQTTFDPADGFPAFTFPLSISTQPVVTIGGADATVQFAGLTPRLVGIYQIDVKIPESAPSGKAVPVSMTVGGVASNTVTIAVE